MDFLAISPESDTADEARVIARLIDAGLYRYHLRKPAQSAAELGRLLERLPPAYRQRVVVHQHPELVADFGLGGYHCKDRAGATAERESLQTRLHTRWRARDAPSSAPLTLSRSLHAIDDLAAACAGWDYVLISPAFASISKAGYHPNWTSDELCAALLAPSTAGAGKRYALGGICAANAAHCIALGFDGVVLHGALWRAADPVAEVKNCRQQVDAWLAAASNCQPTAKPPPTNKDE